MLKQTSHKKRFFISFFVLSILLAIAGTIAYYAEQQNYNNKFRIASDVIDHIEDFTPRDWAPCDETPKTLITTNRSEHPIQVRLKYDEWWRNQADTENLPLEQNGTRLAVINFQNEDDWELNGEWYYWKGELAPGESTRSLFKSVTFDCRANFAVQHVCTDQGCEDVHSPYEGSNYHVFITVQTTSQEFPPDEDMRTVTVDPNGGIYKGSNQAKGYEVYIGDDYILEDASRDGYTFDHWEYEDGTVLSGNTIKNIQNNVTVKATWLPAVARIERTGKLYASIMNAEAEAQSGDTITLLVDTTETVTNEKTVTLNLGAHTITGSLTNTANGSLTLINGEINNPEGIAVTNNGTLTMGIDDFKDDGKVNIDNNYVRLIGTTTGIKQNGVFNFYDGFLEGDVGLEGGYNDAPEYRNTFDGTIVHYFPLVDHNWVKDCQHVELANADLAVSKTTVMGDIYYYNLQDNINTSARTGYRIYIVRNFDASYPLISPVGTNVNIDLVGYTVAAGDNITIDGILNISDSSQTTGEGSEAVTTKGIITVRQSITVNNGGTLNIDGAEVQEITSNTLLHNQGAVNLTNGAKLSSTNGNVMIMTNDEILPNMDATSIITSSSTSKATILNRRRSDMPLEINGGVIHSSARYAIENDISGTVINLNGGEVRISNSASYAIYDSQNNSPYGSLIINGGKINLDNVTNGAIAVYRMGVEIKSGEIVANGSGAITGIQSCSGTVEMSGGKIEIKSSGETYGSRCAMNLTGGEIFSESTGYDSHGVTSALTATGGSIHSKAARYARGFEGDWITYNTFDGGVSITAESTATSSSDYAARAVSGSAYYTFNDATVTAITTNGQSRAIDSGSWGTITINGGTYTASSVNGSSYAVVINSNANYTGNVIDRKSVV